MDRRVVLIALWAVFATAAVGVGFGAAGLVGDPFTDGDVGTATTATPFTGSPSASAGDPTPTASSTSSPSAASSVRSGGGLVRGSQTTRGGLVTGTCEDGLVRLSAAPEIGWEVDDLDSGARDEARVRFERVDDGDGKVEVRATCRAGRPDFMVRDDSSGSGSGWDDTDDTDD